MPRPALFLDRDGVIVEEVDYLARPDQVVLVQGAALAISRVNRANIPVVVATNQSGTARGYFPEERIGVIHRHIDALLARRGAHVDRYYYCPHHPSADIEAYRLDCACRKPRPGMLLAAAAELGLDLSRSLFVGDKISDLQAGLAAGCTPILVRTGYGKLHEQQLAESGLSQVMAVRDMAEAVDWWLARGDGIRNES